MGIMNFLRSNKCTVTVLTPQNAPAKYPAPDEQIWQRLAISNDSKFSGKTSAGAKLKSDHLTSSEDMKDNDHEKDNDHDCIINIYAKTAHRPVHWISSQALFHSDKALLGPQDMIFPGSFTLELYSAFTKFLPIEEGSVMDIIAAKMCPQTHTTCPNLLCN
ncbi:uncharacterized protein LOC125179081 [Hyalella azteca]|uniref:Uncharacterized protein LOC125179081 n=1 Tax=Hyalella azteca TaxID=294128 RepID=A0A979FUU9_HYAAZ|nr:uncharacterized protein LOC125179081 [Hyalella azteca]